MGERLLEIERGLKEIITNAMDRPYIDADANKVCIKGHLETTDDN